MVSSRRLSMPRVGRSPAPSIGGQGPSGHRRGSCAVSTGVFAALPTRRRLVPCTLALCRVDKASQASAKLVSPRLRQGGLPMIRIFITAVALIAALAGSAQAQQDYPNRLIKIMQGFPPGGNVDIIARILAHQMEQSLGQSMVVEAKPGLAGALAAETIARSEPDGYSLLVLPSAHPAYAALAKNVKFKVVDDFSWISVASFYPFMICVKADSRFKTLK